MQSSQYLAVVSDVAPLVVEGVEDQVSLVLGDAVAVDGVAGRHHLPGQPARGEGLVAGQHVGQVARLKAAAAFVVRHRFSNSLDLTLVAVGTWWREEGEGTL